METFSLKRFGLLVSWHFRQYLKAYAMGALVFMGITALLFVTIVSMRNGVMEPGNQYLVYFLVMYVGLFVFSSLVFLPYQRPKEAMFNLLLPASSLEKYSLAWLLSFVFYTVCANALFFLVRFLISQYYEARGYIVESMWSYERLYGGSKGLSFVAMILLFYVCLHAFAFLGSIIFTKLATLKSALLLLLLLVLFSFFNTSLINAMFDNEQVRASLLPFTSTYIKIADTTYTISLDSSHYLLFGLFSFAILSLWGVAYFKLREKEV